MKIEYWKSGRLLNIFETVLDCHKVCKNMVFGYFHPKTSDDILLFIVLSNNSTSGKGTIARYGWPIRMTISLVNITKTNHMQRNNGFVQ